MKPWLLILILLSSCQTPAHWRFVPGDSSGAAMAHSHCGSYDGSFVALGGIDENEGTPFSSELFIYSEAGKGWQRIGGEPIFTPRNFFASALLSDKLYVFGGETAKSTATADAFFFDLRHQTWEQLSTPPALDARKKATLTPLAQELVLFGGQAPQPVTNWARYHTRNTEWSVHPLPPSIASRVSHIAVPIGDAEVFIWGGFSNNERRNDGFTLTIKTQKFEPLPPAPLSARANAKALVIAHKVFIWGGVADEASSNSGAVFDLSTRQWQTLPAIPDARFQNLRGGELAAWKEGFLLVGGRFGSEDFNERLWYFDRSRWEWTELPSTAGPEGRLAHCISLLGPDRLAVFGGLGYRAGTRSLTHFEGLWLLQN